MDWQQTTLNGAGRDAFIQLVRTPVDKRSQQAIAASEAATQPLLALLDSHLAQRPFMAGERLTMADITIGFPGDSVDAGSYLVLGDTRNCPPCQFLMSLDIWSRVGAERSPLS